MSLSHALVLAIAATIAIQLAAAGVFRLHASRRRRSRTLIRRIRSYTA